MFIADDLANWWDRNRHDSEIALDQFVERNPGLFGVTVATATKTSMDLGAGMVDLLRLGKGAGEGGWGFAADGMRLLGLTGPLARGGRLFLTRALKDPAKHQGICAYVAIGKALRLTGQRHFVSMEDVFARAGTSLAQAGGISLPRVRRIIELLGVRASTTAVRAGAPFIEGVRRLRRSHMSLGKDGVHVVGVEWEMVPGRTVGHALIVYFEGGQMWIADRCGRIVRSLEGLADKYPGIANARVQADPIFIPNARFARLFEGTGTLAFELRAQLLAPTSVYDELLEQIRSARRAARETTHLFSSPDAWLRMLGIPGSIR